MAASRPARLVLVRHGESLRNIAMKSSRYFLDDEARRPVRGIPDHQIPLTAHGHEQARITGVALRERFGPFDQLYHSGYRRTIDTTEAMLAAYPPEERARIRVRHHLFIRERDQGHAYDMTDAEAAAAFPWLQDYWNTFGPFFARPPGGESLAQVCERVYTFLQKLARTMAGKRVLIVTHGGTIWCFRYVIERWTYEEAEERFRTEHIRNCSVTAYELDAAGHLALTMAGRTWWSADDLAGTAGQMG
jgi:2,3-bisphosphoglycerate-dependent phosphoglycerate mutase